MTAKSALFIPASLLAATLALALPALNIEISATEQSRPTATTVDDTVSSYPPRWHRRSRAMIESHAPEYACSLRGGRRGPSRGYACASLSSSPRSGWSANPRPRPPIYHPVLKAEDARTLATDALSGRDNRGQCRGDPVEHRRRNRGRRRLRA
jgi:hypothetical protein